MTSLPTSAHAGPLRALLGRGGDASRQKSYDWPADRVQRDVAYGSDPAQRFDVYLPVKVDHPRIMLMVHGGGWARGDKLLQGVWQDKAKHWTAQGWIFISTNYRMIPQANPLEQARDVARALAKVQQMAPSWGADPHGVILMGHSAGAHLVALLTAKPQWAYEQGAQAWKASISLDSGAMDVTEIMAQSHPRFYDRAFGDKPEFWRATSPTLQLTAQATPLMLVCSTRRSDSCGQLRAFAARAKTLGVVATVQPEDLSHGEINEELGLPGAYTDNVDRFIARLTAHDR
jgi:acetyl esterase/lipase